MYCSLALSSSVRPHVSAMPLPCIGLYHNQRLALPRPLSFYLWCAFLIQRLHESCAYLCCRHVSACITGRNGRGLGFCLLLSSAPSLHSACTRGVHACVLDMCRPALPSQVAAASASYALVTLIPICAIDVYLVEREWLVGDECCVQRLE